MILYCLLLLSLAFSDQRFFDYRLFGFTVEKYLGVVCLLYALAYLPFRKLSTRLFSCSQVRAFLLFFVLAAISWVTLSRQPFQGSMLLVYVSQLAIMLSTLILLDSEKRLRWALIAAVAGVAWASLYDLREWQKALPVYGFGYRPLWSPAGDPNYFTASAVLCFCVAYYLFLKAERRPIRMLILACMAPIVGAILVDASRGGLFGLIAAGAVIFMESRGRRGRLVALGGVLTVIFMLSPASPVRRFLHPNSGDVAAENDRLELWSAGLHMLEEHPLSGIGLGNFRSEVPLYLAPGSHIDFMAHNTYVEMAAEMGLPGLAIFLWIVAATFSSLVRTRRIARENGSTLIYCAASGLLAGFAGFSVAIFFLSADFLKFLWFAVSLSAAVENLASDTLKDSCAADSEVASESGAWPAAAQQHDLAPLVRFSRDG